MDLSHQQELAVSAFQSWFKLSHSREENVFRLFGYAGTGKTTIARVIAREIGGDVRFGAFTGKAAHVLQKNGCPSATTIHRMIYQPSDPSGLFLRKLEDQCRQTTDAVRGELKKKYPDEEPTEIERLVYEDREVRDLQVQIAKERKRLKKPLFDLNEDADIKEADLIIIDECSMVDDRMGKDLLSFGRPILVLGDPAQLPPVGAGGFFTDHKPDIMLTDIHRQAAGNPILELATKVRQGEHLEVGDYGESRVLDWADIDPEDANGHTQIIVGRNKTRRGTNRRIREIRELRGADEYGRLPVPGDRLVCLRNNHEMGLMNGSVWNVLDAVDLGETQGLTVEAEEGGVTLSVEAHTAIFHGLEIDWWDRKKAEEFDYGYALTCHKAQGSQWPSVLVFDESGCFREHGRRWLYTAITRAVDRVTVVV